MSVAIGAFARIWTRPSVDEVASSMRAAGMDVAHWNFSAVGRPTVSEEIGVEEFTAVADEFARTGPRLWGLSVTHNITHPDQALRSRLQSAAKHMIRHAQDLGVRAVAVCAGSMSESGWAYHPENRSTEAWNLMRKGLDELSDVATEHGVVLGVEPEPGSIVSDADRALQLLSEVGDGAPVGFILDPWNLLEGRGKEERQRVLDHAFASLAGKTIVVHAKDPIGSSGTPVTVDYAQVASLHRRFCSDVPVVIQDVSENDIPRVADWLRQAWTKDQG